VRVRVGQPVSIRLDGLENHAFTGRIEFIAPSIDPKTRTALARVRLANPDGTLRANMFGRARIVLDADRTGLAVPRAAVQNARGVAVVFVRLADDVYETRRVQVASRQGDQVELAGTCTPATVWSPMAASCSKPKTLKESIGAGCCDGQTSSRC
jgi:cobalt-zinc-cadmium efflux system membrane fusion protein